MKKYLLLFALSITTLTSCDQKTLDAVLNSSGVLSDADISKGLKQALEKGVDNSVTYLAKEGGYYQSVYKILLPAEAQMVTSKLRVIPGFGNLEEEVVKRINKAAEDAASKAGPIFLNAITQMTFADVRNILMGEKNAATNYLQRVTYAALYDEFKPVVVGSLNKFGALDYWGNAINSYNKIPFVDKVNPDLADHVTNNALKGLFALIEQKELGIRTDISQRTSDLLKKVFAKQD
ncbi:MAG TPA: DUF4197 domain-containing protein [Saprospiraceae bacterium]|nr:DUF4197 domain-containing protein [Saprospiraceae bacterium]HPN72330.1 DUF4197 domain-containing protein [Saprospiraceae bacterium]